MCIAHNGRAFLCGQTDSGRLALRTWQRQTGEVESRLRSASLGVRFAGGKSYSADVAVSKPLGDRTLDNPQRKLRLSLMQLRDSQPKLGLSLIALRGGVPRIDNHQQHLQLHDESSACGSFVIRQQNRQ